MKQFGLEEIARNDGKDGRPAYIVYQDKVYDVSESFLWKKGRHQVLHQAGKDLTGMLKNAPHGKDLLSRVPLIGYIKK